jgi:hypothetical protein
MKKFLLLCCILFAVSSALLAGVDIRVNADLALPAMTDFNASLTALSNYRSFLYPDAKKIENMQLGMNLNLDVLFRLFPYLSAGLRTGYDFCFQSSVENKNIGLNSGMLTKFDANLIPLMLGLELSVAVPKTSFLITAGGFGGYGFVSLNQNQTLTLLGYARTGNITYSGGGFTGDIYGGFVYKIAGIFSLGLNAGYRTAVMSGMTAGADSTDTVAMNILKGEEYKDPSGNAVALDYSGVNFGLSLKFEF